MAICLEKLQEEAEGLEAFQIGIKEEIYFLGDDSIEIHRSSEEQVTGEEAGVFQDSFFFL